VSQLERLRQIARGEVEPPPIAKLIGFRLTDVEEGRAIFEMEVGPQHWNPQGTLHGGIMCDIADAAMGMAFGSIITEEGVSFTTVELKINYLRPIRTGLLKATGYVVKSGRTIGLTECDLHDADGRLVARASSTCMILRPDS
jgi:uncharacterized protein (TIGR00369 family)